jgi:hypothetical protein
MNDSLRKPTQAASEALAMFMFSRHPIVGLYPPVLAHAVPEATLLYTTISRGNFLFGLAVCLLLQKRGRVAILMVARVPGIVISVASPDAARPTEIKRRSSHQYGLAKMVAFRNEAGVPDFSYHDDSDP